jgi:hypothetical protein
MVAVVRVVRVLLLLVLVVITLSLVIAVASGDTGLVEKLVLLALIAGCVYVAAKVSTLATRVVRRLS